MEQLLIQYNKTIHDLNRAFNNYIQNYKNEYINFKTAEFKNDLMINTLNSSQYFNNHPNDPYVITKKNIDNLNNEYFNLLNEMSASVEYGSSNVKEMQENIDDLKSKNEILREQANNLVDTSKAAKPFYEEEKILYYRMIVKIISLIIGSIVILYLLQKTPLKDVSSSAINASKQVLINAGEVTKTAIQETGANSMRNIFIAILIGLIIIVIFALVLYIIRKLKENKKNNDNSTITADCSKCKSENWIETEMKKIMQSVSNE